MNVVRIDSGIFKRLINCMRWHQDPENMSIELQNEFGDILIYEDGLITIIHNDMLSDSRVYCDISMEQLCKEQRGEINAVLIEQVHRVVHNIIEEVMDVE